MKRVVTIMSVSLFAAASWANPLTTLFTSSSSSNTPNPQVMKLATDAYDCAIGSGVAKPGILTVIDYSLPSNQKRMWVIDMKTKKTLYNTYVAHGKGSGNTTATKFSNVPQSLATSLGLFKTADSYMGGNGYSLRLIGLDAGYNNNAYARNVVIHGAPYVSESIAQKTGRVGRSWGCPAVPQPLAKPIINTIKGGNLVFAYYPNTAWMKSSKYLNCPANLLAKANSDINKTA